MDGGLFRRSWFETVTVGPSMWRHRIRYWDLAGEDRKRKVFCDGPWRPFPRTSVGTHELPRKLFLISHDTGLAKLNPAPLRGGTLVIE